MKEGYLIEVCIKWGNVITAINEKEAIETVKNNFYEEYGIKITDSEIKSVVKEGGKHENL